MVLQFVERQMVVHVLLHVESWDEPKGHPCDHAEGAERDHGAGEVLRGLVQDDHAAVCGDQFQGHDVGSESRIARTRSMRTGRAGADHRDVRE
ncbi:hypothetical protein ACWGLF_45120 [Streptomyces puniciscabiei]